MHDPLEIDDGIRLRLPDLLHQGADGFVIRGSIRRSDLIDPDGKIDLPELLLCKDIRQLSGGIPLLRPEIQHAPGMDVEDGYGLPAKEARELLHAAVAPKAVGPGIPDEQSVLKITLVHLCKIPVVPVGREDRSRIVRKNKT